MGLLSSIIISESELSPKKASCTVTFPLGRMNHITTAIHLVITEPHHIPGDRSPRQANYHYRILETVFEFVVHYIRNGRVYEP